jgi:hypothetical protein
MAYFADVEKATRMLHFKQNHSATLVQRWFSTSYGKETRTTNPFASGTGRLQKLVAFVRAIRADDQVTKVPRLLVRLFSVVRKNPQGGQAGNWVSLTWQCEGCYVSDCLSGRPNFKWQEGFKAH